jgi:hypothetical protein
MALLTAWGVGGIIGPQITAYMKDNFGAEAGTILLWLLYS